jgi:hypothetical protein
MAENAARRLSRGSGADISIAVRQESLWSAMVCIVLVGVSGLSCSSSPISPTAVDSAIAVDTAVDTTVDASVDASVDSTVDAALDPGCMAVLSQTAEDTGVESCNDGTLRRRAAIQCPWPPMGPPPPVTACNVVCASDSDCSGNTAVYPKGYCPVAHNVSGVCGCVSGCREDADCGPAMICECDAAFGHCAFAACATNADCGAGLACVATAEGTSDGTCNLALVPSDPPHTFVCQTATDTCRGKTDCADAGTTDADATAVPACLYDGTRRACGIFCRLHV